MIVRIVALECSSLASAVARESALPVSASGSMSSVICLNHPTRFSSAAAALEMRLKLSIGRALMRLLVVLTPYTEGDSKMADSMTPNMPAAAPLSVEALTHQAQRLRASADALDALAAALATATQAASSAPAPAPVEATPAVPATVPLAPLISVS